MIEAKYSHSVIERARTLAVEVAKFYDEAPLEKILALAMHRERDHIMGFMRDCLSAAGSEDISILLGILERREDRPIPKPTLTEDKADE